MARYADGNDDEFESRADEAKEKAQAAREDKTMGEWEGREDEANFGVRPKGRVTPRPTVRGGSRAR